MIKSIHRRSLPGVRSASNRFPITTMNAAAFIFSRHNRTTLASFWICSLLFMLGTAAVAHAQSLDTSFNPGANGEVRALAVQADGKILVGGDFTTLGGGGTGTTTRNYLGRLNADGSLDTSFNPGANGSVWALAVQADGKILVGGGFTGLGGSPSTGWTPRNHIGRLNANGSVDTSFNPGADGAVFTLVVQSDGKILVGGDFFTLGGAPRGQIGRLLAANGSPDSFDPGTNDKVWTVAVQADGKVWIGGDFIYLNYYLTPRNRIARLNAGGSLDTSVGGNDGVINRVSALAVQPADGKILVGGDFTALGFGGGLIGSATRNLIGRLNADGSLDTNFNPGAGPSGYGGVQALVVQADGKILVGGYFWTLGGGGTGTTTRNCLGRLNVNGSVDTSFNPGANSTVEAMAVQADGKILVGGAFTTLGGGGTGTTTRNYIGRLTVTAVDTSPPTTSAFSVSPTSISVGSSVNISFTVSDTGGSGLSSISLYRAPDASGSPGTWAAVGPYFNLSGNGPTNNTFNDTPAAGKWWYGFIVFDGNGNWNNEQNQQTGYSPDFPPVEVTVAAADTTPPTVSFLSPTNGQVITNASLTITGTATDPGSPSTGISTVEVRTNGASWQTATGTTSWTRSIRLSLLCNNIIEARSRDKVGNYSATNLISIIYTGANVAPNKPSNLSPTNSAINVPITPTLQASAFSDSNCGDAQAAAQWQVLLNGTGTTVLWDSGTNTINKTNIVVAAGKLSYWTTNRWQVRYRDSQGAWSSYSTQTMFITVPPSLSIRLQGTNAILTWPTNTTLFRLEYTTNMSAASWTTNSSTPKIVGGKYTITNGMSGKAKVYHLKK